MKLQSQSTSKILMIKPASFGFNSDTAKDNSFQNQPLDLEKEAISQKAIQEFNAAVKTLENHKIEVIVFDDTITPITPDAIFPNNWFSTHSTGELIVYPMYSENRSDEKRGDILAFLQETQQYTLSDWSFHETEEQYLEGTGSMVLDRGNKICYAALSKRTNEKLLLRFCEKLNYKPVIFNASDDDETPIYHTNVLMAITEKLAIICLETIKNSDEKELLLASFQNTAKEVIEISYQQMCNFAGNVLEVQNSEKTSFLVLSQRAKSSFTASQIKKIEKYHQLISINIPTIETVGGGGIRCMIAEIFEKK